MGCTFSGLNALYDVVNGGGDVWINERRFKIVRQIGEGGFAFVYLVKEQTSLAPAKEPKDPSHVSEDGMYALKKVLIQTDEQLQLVKQEIQVSSLLNHSNLLPLLDHSIIAVKEGTWSQEAYLLFPVFLDGTLLDNTQKLKARREHFPTDAVLHIFRQLCAGLKHMHSLDPPYAHNDVKPGNVLIKWRKGQPPLAILMDFGSAAPAKREVRSRSDALKVQEWAAEHCSAPYRAPELWDCTSYSDIDERTDIWSLGCTLYAIMQDDYSRRGSFMGHEIASKKDFKHLRYGMSPFEHSLGEAGGSLQLAVMSGQIKWPPGPSPPYPESLHQFVTWMLQPQAAIRPCIDDIIIHVDKLLSKFSS